MSTITKAVKAVRKAVKDAVVPIEERSFQERYDGFTKEYVELINKYKINISAGVTVIDQLAQASPSVESQQVGQSSN